MAARTDASKLFDLFRDREEFTVLDRAGDPVTTISLQALDWQQNNALVKTMESARIRVRADMEKNGERKTIEDSVSQLTAEQIIDVIVGIERPVATNVADLAPNGTSDEAAAAKKKEDEAIKKWEEARRTELKTTELAELREIVVRRQESLFVQARAVQDYINDSLVLMVVDSETGECVFSKDADAKNYVGTIMPELRNQILKFREDFLAKRAEKPIRKAAEDSSFLSSGESPSPPIDSPGGTTETPRRSPRTRSASTTAAAG
jgi:hypothetical protein